MSRYLEYLRPVLLFVGLALLVPAGYAYHLGEETWKAFLLSSALLLAPGIRDAAASLALFAENLWRVFVRKERQLAWNRVLSPVPSALSPPRPSDVVVVAALAWILIPVLTAIPFWSAGYSLENALFESMSGWTTTGLSFTQNLDALPRSLVFFRSFIQWIGGVGIILFALLALRSPAALQLLRAESRDTVALGVVDTVKAIWGIYLALTLACVALLAWSGLALFESVNYALALLSTGGFGPSDSFALSALQKGLFIAFMLAGATSFSLHYALLRGQFRKLVENTEFKMLLAGIALFSVLVALSVSEGWLDAVFNVASAATTTGFATESFSGWGAFSTYLLVLLMLAGVCSGSTGGALKLWRIFALLKTLVARVRAGFLPAHAVQVIKVNQKVLKSDDVVESGTFIFLYLFVFMLGVGGLTALGQPYLESVFLAASALGNVGLSVGANWFSFPLIGKAVLFVLMWLGRIEILPSLVLLRALRHPGE